MRTKLLAAAAILAAGLASSMAQSNVYSLNVVGYVNKVFLGNNQYSMIANPLNSTNNTISGLLQGVPLQTKVLKFDPNIGDYVTYTRVIFGSGWTPPAGATVSLNPGEGVLIQSPAASADITNTFVGEVLQGSLTNTYIAGYNLSGNKVPDAGTVTAIGLTPATPLGSKLLKFDPNIQDYATFTRVVFGSGWTPSLPSIDVGEGFFIQNLSGSPFDWVRNFTVQ